VELSTDDLVRAAKSWRVQVCGDCWIWAGSYFASGYGRVGISMSTYKAHRVAYHLACGPFDDALLVCHRCDVKQCVNPAHLFLGTHADNHTDRNSKGRQAAGERMGNAKIDDEQAICVMARLLTGRETQKTIASAFGISPGGVNKMWTGRTWLHLFADTDD
jgi:hypothetical protein